MTTLHWPCETLWEQLVPLCPGLSIEAAAEVDSSNTRLLERARRGDTAPCLLVAERQSAGRGRQGRPWHSAPGASLTFSLGLPCAPRDWAGLSLAVGVALAEALPAGIVLKWPNDLWLRDGGRAGRKLGGILIETTGLAPGEAGRYVVVGVGLNVQPIAAPDGRNAVGALQELEPALTAPALLQRVAEPLLRALLGFEQSGFAPFAARFAVLDALRDLPVRTTHAEAPEGVARGVDASGALRLETAAGLRIIESGEVSVRPC
ncbi:biotin--[acetyl-CoA-carboxylase] ligase [Aquabacterium sp. A7-Y]|uniref:biotin--[acetyl-CoA-carboxylase] ligase n=1 Tax=Aquabacterium sp. A7-Y TaxID=1349605 RepID=UPI00223DD2B4|nr:biotin--[acetyl-CoA-carboxylase] ligase [Aquabacterium sp. A7-Y]MCW7536673.1 biotin--[acetyl-CoA-carboxylase] ligase [Aquabacterium sp. A7-Y]